MQTEDGRSVGCPTDEGFGEGEEYFNGVHVGDRGADDFVWPDRSAVDVAAAV